MNEAVNEEYDVFVRTRSVGHFFLICVWLKLYFCWIVYATWVSHTIQFLQPNAVCFEFSSAIWPCTLRLQIARFRFVPIHSFIHECYSETVHHDTIITKLILNTSLADIDSEENCIGRWWLPPHNLAGKKLWIYKFKDIFSLQLCRFLSTKTADEAFVTA